MLAVSNYFLKQQDRFNIPVFIFYIFKWCYASYKKEMNYEECVRRIIIITIIIIIMQKNRNSTFCDKYINNNNIIIIIINLWSNLGQEKYTRS